MVVFASGSHLLAPEALLEGVQAALGPRALIGCGAGGVLGETRELESGTAVAVWAVDFGDTGEASVFHATVHSDGNDAWLDGLPELSGAAGAILLSDPHSFPTDLALADLAERSPTVPVLGGLASARTEDGTAPCSAAPRCMSREQSACRCAGSRCSRASPRARHPSAAR